MNLSEALREGTRLLRSAGSDEAKLEAEMLLMHALEIDRIDLYQNLREPLPTRGERTYRRLLDRRVAHEPTPYIMGKKEFFGLEFEVSSAALIPRPETEALVELAIDFSNKHPGNTLTIADIGTGSGVIAVSLAFRLLNARVIATDTSKRALTLAERNAERHNVASRIEFRQGDLLAPIDRRVDVIAANLPYVTADEWNEMPPEIREHEPKGALHAGPDGLRLVRKLFRQAPDKVTTNGAIFAEIGANQGATSLYLARHAFRQADLEVAKDLAGLDRVLCIYT